VDYLPLTQTVSPAIGEEATNLPGPNLAEWVPGKDLQRLLDIRNLPQSSTNMQEEFLYRIPPALDWEKHSNDYRQRKERWIAEFRSNLEDRCRRAESAIDEYRRWCWEVKEPAELIRRRSEDGGDPAPPVKLILPALRDGRFFPAALTNLQWEYQRLQAWAQEGASLPGGSARLANRLTELLAEMKEEDRAQAQRCRLDRALLLWNPSVNNVPTGECGMEKFRWRAHYQYFLNSQNNAVEVVTDLGQYAINTGRVSDQDVRLAVYAAHTHWRTLRSVLVNTREWPPEKKLARQLDDALGILLVCVQQVQADRIFQELVKAEKKVNKDEDGRTYPYLYILNELAMLSRKTPLQDLANDWLRKHPHEADSRYQEEPPDHKGEKLQTQLDLLKKVLEP
jgi:hypothetical protein